MVMDNNKSATAKNAGKSLVSSIAMCRCGGMRWGALPNRARPGLHSEPLDAAIGRVPVPYRPGPGGRHGRRICQNNTKD